MAKKKTRKALDLDWAEAERAFAGTALQVLHIDPRLQRNLRGNTVVVTRCLRRPLQILSK